MISDIYDLSETITKVATRIVEISTQNTTEGSWICTHDDVEDLISYEDYLQYFDFIAYELSGREEVLELEAYDEQFDASYALNYCPNYIWHEGDGEIFHMTEEEWEQSFQALPISKPLPMHRLAQIGQSVIENTLQNGDKTIGILTEGLGLSTNELTQLGINAPNVTNHIQENKNRTIPLNNLLESAIANKPHQKQEHNTTPKLDKE